MLHATSVCDAVVRLHRFLHHPYPIPHVPCLFLSTNPVVLVPLLPASIVESTYLEESFVLEDSAIELGSQTPDSSFLV